MATVEGENLIKHYFFGFAKFFSFPDNAEIAKLKPDDMKNAKLENKISHKIPKLISCTTSFDKTFVSWSGIFHLTKATGKVHVYGWCNGRKIEANEYICLPIKSKILNLAAGWNKLLLISNDGLCHVISDIQDSWTVTECKSKTKFIACGIGELHKVVLDENGQVCELKTNMEFDSSKINNLHILLSPIQIKEKVDYISCGKEHVLLLNATTGHVFSYGLGSRGQLGHGAIDAETTPKVIEALAGLHIKQIAAGGWHSLALSNIGDIYAWGWNIHGQLGITCLPPEVPQAFYMLPYIVDFPQECMVENITCGARHSGAVTSDPRGVWTWGWGEYGQLGQGDSQDRVTPTLVKYFQDIETGKLNITCGPWQTIVSLE